MAAVADLAPEPPAYPREGYRPDWLALEDAAGGRFLMKGDLEKEVPAFDNTFTALAKLWPQFEEELQVFNEEASLSSGALKVRIYKPHASKLLPLMVFFHGGGFFCGNLETEDGHCRYFAAKTPCVVISVDYPLCPPAHFQQIIEAGVESFTWAQENAARFGADRTKMITCGGSMGSTLSAQVAYHFMAAGDQEAVAGCILMFCSVASWKYKGRYKEEYNAWKEFGHAKAPVVSLEVVQFMGDKYWQPDWENPAHYPLNSTDLSKFPPCYIMSAEMDCCRDDGVLLNKLLQEDGGKSKFDLYRGLPHWFHAFPQFPPAHEMMDKTVAGIQWVLEQKSA